MTINSSLRKAGPYVGNDVSTSFPFSFKVFDDTDVLVTFSDANGVETSLSLGIDYLVTLNPDQSQSPGGVVTYPVMGDPLSADEKITLTGNLPYDQPTDITNQGGFYPKVIENALDRAVIQIQQIEEQVRRTLKAPISGDYDMEQILRQLETQLQYVTAVYNNLQSIIDVIGNEVNINIVAGDIANVNSVGGNIADVITVANIDGQVASVAANEININKVADNEANINTVADNETAINQVVANEININTVAADIANVNTVGQNIQSVNDVASIKDDVTDVAAIKTDVSKVSAIDIDVATVAANESEIQFVAQDLNGQPLTLDYGDLSPAQNPAAPSGAIGAIYANQQSIYSAGTNIGAIIMVANNLQAILDALIGGLRPSNNLSELTDPEQARANLGLADMGDLS